MKNPKYLVPALALCGLVSLGPASCPKKAPGPATPEATANAEKAPQPPQRVYDERFGITLIVPADWSVTRKPNNPVLFAVAPGAGQYGPMANVVVEKLNQRMAPYDYLEANILGMRISLPGLAIKQGGVELGAGAANAWIHYSYPRKEITVEAIAYCRTVEYNAYVVTAVAPDEMFEKQEPLFRTIGRSLRID